MKKFLCVLLAAFMLLGLTACDNDGESTNPAATTGGGVTNQPSSGGERTITVGTWYDIYYVSKHQTIEANPRLNNPLTAQLQLDNMRAIEEKHGVKVDYVNLTWEGIQESIVTSIMAGLPDCDIYVVDTQFGIPAVLSGSAESLEKMGLEGTDVFTDQVVMKYLNVGQPETYLFAKAVTGGVSAYPLAFNMDMIKDKGLENPQDLWDKGEWTWDKWREYLIALTDTDNGVYGWSGYWTNALTNLLHSNGTSIASGPQTTITSSATIEVFDLFYTIYNLEKTARPWDDTAWEVNNKMYADGKSAFWIGADWIFQEFGGGENPLPFEIGVVPWPVGPSGNKDTNTHGDISGNWYMIPRGTPDARLVYDVIYDWENWFNFDRAVAEDFEWSQNMYMTQRNFDYAYMMSQNCGLDLWGDLNIGDDMSMVTVMNAENTGAQYAESVKQIIQDSLDRYFG